MAIIDSFRPNATTLEVRTVSAGGFAVTLPLKRFIQFSAWPEDITGLERILLTARGDLQRMLRCGVIFRANHDAY